MNQNGRFGFGYTLIGSTSFGSVFGCIRHEPGYLYVRVWRWWVRVGQRKPASSPIQVLTTRIMQQDLGT